MKPVRRWVLVIAAVGGVILFLVRFLGRPSVDQLALAALTALRRGQREDARQLAMKAVAQGPQSTAARLVAAEVEFDAGRLESALAHLEKVKDDRSRTALRAVTLEGDVLYRLHRLCEAEARWRRVVERDRHNHQALRRLANVLAMSGRKEAVQLFLEIVKDGPFTIRDLSLLGDPEKIYRDPECEELFEGQVADDVCVARGAARYALHRQDSQKAAERFRKLVDRQRDDVELLAGLGRALVEAATADEFLHWHARLPPAAEEYAEIWNVRGRYAQMHAQYDAAIRCYGEAIRRDANHVQANYQMAVLLHQRGQDDRAQVFQRRADQLAMLANTLGSILASENRSDLWLHAAQLTEELGRPWEAWGWYCAAIEESDREGLRAKAESLKESLNEATPQTLPAANPAATFDLSVYPLPVWIGQTPSLGAALPSRVLRPTARVMFTDLARESGLNFTYHNGYDADIPGRRIFETLGGGVAALDFDGDLWPDLYFTQGDDWPPRPGQTDHLDRLFRNLANGQFVDVTHVSGLGDERYSHGVSAGDVDNDGFPDLYVANIGANRLYQNNGDGTFNDCTARARLNGSGWTTSALIADLNGDGLPEIYDVTYLAGSAPFERICFNGGVPAPCSPIEFAAEPDRLYLNRGDGTFEDISDRAGILVPDGKGLGIAAFDFNGSGRLSLYVANDLTDSFLFINLPRHAGDLPLFVEQGKLAGCAVNADGKAQASMGIAVDDADGDGLIDLFVTNFYNEYAVLYRQLSGGCFEDVSAWAQLKKPTVHTLGFGTQFLDADLNGLPDLVVANGHIDDFRRQRIPFRMRAQFFANSGEGRFDEVPPGQLGDYFQREQLGRGLARLDWNRDGREDFAVSNLDTPVSLVTNRTTGAGHFLALQLRGVQSNRDAIGSTVSAVVGERTFLKQMTAGDGYQASNQRQLVFGLGDSTLVDTLHIHWPSGEEQEFSSVSADLEYLVVEGRPELVRLPMQRSDVGDETPVKATSESQ